MEQIVFLQEPVTWVAVSFAIVVAGLAKFVAPLIVKSLDKRSTEISEELARAIALREEAEATLIKYQKKQEESLREADEIVQKANLEARRITKEAEQQAEATLEKRTRMAMEKIAMAEGAAMQEVKARVAQVAVAAAQEILKSNLAKKTQDDMVQKAAGEIERKLH